MRTSRPRFQLFTTTATLRLAARKLAFINPVLCATFCANNYLHNEALSLPVFAIQFD